MDNQTYILSQRLAPTIARLTLNRPSKRNALHQALLQQLDATLDEISTDKSLKVVILDGEGSSFCSGLDLQESADPATAAHNASLLASILGKLYTLRAVTIASAHGVAFGGGGALLLACDLAIGIPDLQIGFPEINRGLLPAQVHALMRHKLTGSAIRAFLLTGATYSGLQALAFGALTHLASDDNWRDDTLTLAQQIATAAPNALSSTKKMIHTSETPIHEELQRAAALYLTLLADPEAQEGLAAFLSKRIPNWHNVP